MSEAISTPENYSSMSLLENSEKAIFTTQKHAKKEMAEVSKPENEKVHDAFTHFVEKIKPNINNYFVLLDEEQPILIPQPLGMVNVENPYRYYFIPQTLETYFVEGKSDLSFQLGLSRILKTELKTSQVKIEYKDEDLPEKQSSLEELKKNGSGEFEKIELKESEENPWNLVENEIYIVEKLYESLTISDSDSEIIEAKKKFDEEVKNLNLKGIELEKIYHGKIKLRILNHINNFINQYKVPSLICLYDSDSKIAKKSKEIYKILNPSEDPTSDINLYLVNEDNTPKIVTMSKKKNFGISRPDLESARELTDEEYVFYKMNIIHGLKDQIPQLKHN